MKWELAIVAAAVLAVAGVSRRLTGTPVTPAMAFVAIGVLVGPLVLDGVTAAPTGATVRLLAEATLAVVLFADASRIKLRALAREYVVPLRLLGVGLPLTIVVGAVLAVAIFDAAEPGRGGRARGRAGADRCRTRTGGGHRAATSVPDPPGTERRERPQRRNLRAAAADRARGGGRRGQGDERPPCAQRRGRGDRVRDPRRRGGRVGRGCGRGGRPSPGSDHRSVAPGHPDRRRQLWPTGSRPRWAARASSPRFSPGASSVRLVSEESERGVPPERGAR